MMLVFLGGRKKNIRWKWVKVSEFEGNQDASWKSNQNTPSPNGPSEKCDVVLTLRWCFLFGGVTWGFLWVGWRLLLKVCVIPPSIVTNAELWTPTQVIQFVTFVSHIWRSRFTIERVSFFPMPKRSPSELPGILVSMLSNDRVSTNLPNCQFEKHVNTCFPPTFWYNTHLLVLYP